MHFNLRDLLLVTDFDQTLALTDKLKPYREARDWSSCARLAPTIPFVPGIEAALQAIAKAGAHICVASSAPRRYLDPFLKRFGPPVTQIMDYHSVRVARGPEYRSRIKTAQLSALLGAHPGRVAVFVGDDIDDETAAARSGIEFVHACWGGPCTKSAMHHPLTPAGFSAIVETIARTATP